MTDDLDDDHARPTGATDADVEAAGKLSEALETVEQARGNLYAFHQLMGHADLQLGEAARALRDAGHDALADAVATEVVGHNVVPGRWTFQLVEEFDDGYYATIRRHERAVRDALMDGRRHVFEAELKARRRTPGRPGHDATP